MNLFTLKSEEMKIRDVQESLQGILELIDFLRDDINNIKLDDFDRVIINSSISCALHNLEDVKLRLEDLENEEL
jgi:hypothetical protein